MARIELIASDIDGTLLDQHGDMPPANPAAFAAAYRRGARLALATVRKRDSTEQIARQLGAPCTLICQGGATIYAENGATLRAWPIPLDLARRIAALADAEALPLVTTIDEVNYYSRGSHPTIRMPASGINVERNQDALVGEPTRLLVRGARGVALLMEAFRDEPLRFVRHYTPAGELLDAAITHRDASKEGALTFLCDRLGIAPAHVLALGDSESDIGMLRLAGVGVAMGDAHPPVRAVADWVAPAAADGGAAAAIRRFALGAAI